MAEPALPAPWRPAPLVAGSAALHVAGAAALALAPRPGPPSAAASSPTTSCSPRTASGRRAPSSAQPLPPAGGRRPPRRGGPHLRRRPGPGGDAAGARPARPGRSAGLLLLHRPAGRRRIPEIVREIARRGHRVENHTWSHPHLFACYPPAAQRREMETAQEAIEEATGRRPGLLPLPGRLPQPLPGPRALDRRPAPRGLDAARLRHGGERPAPGRRAGCCAASRPGTSSSSTTARRSARAAATRWSWRSSPGCSTALAARGLRSVPLGEGADEP